MMTFEGLGMKSVAVVEDARLMRREEKEEHLQRLLGQYLDRLSAKDEPSAVDRRITLVVRSALSPAARAILPHLDQITALDVRVDVVIAKLDPAERFVDWVSQLVDAAGANLNLRWLRREALLEAHEQLAFGRGFAWWGDCMRREPENRDLFEVTTYFDAEAADRVNRAFDALWSVAETAPMNFGRDFATARADTDAANSAAGIAGLGLGEAPVPGQPSVMTRH